MTTGKQKDRGMKGGKSDPCAIAKQMGPTPPTCTLSKKQLLKGRECCSSQRPLSPPPLWAPLPLAFGRKGAVLTQEPVEEAGNRCLNCLVGLLNAAFSLISQPGVLPHTWMGSRRLSSQAQGPRVPYTPLPSSSGWVQEPAASLPVYPRT